MPHPKAKGAIVSAPDPNDYPFDPVHYGAPAPSALPQVVDLRGHTPVPNQGNRPTCVGCSCKILRETLRVLAPASYMGFSAGFIYKHANMLSGALQADNGADPRNALQSMLKLGCCPENVEPYDSDDDITPPSKAADTAARQWRINNYHACKSTTDVLQALAANSPVIVTVRAGAAFDRDAENGVYLLANDTINDQTTPWNHEQVIMGYTGGSDPNTGWLLMEGTWGATMFNKGYYCVQKRYLSQFCLNPWTASLKPLK